jgi:hypothetical protein
MSNYGIILFLVKYIVCLVLLYYTNKTKRTELLFKAVVITFITFSIMIIANLLLAIFKGVESSHPFYEINGIDFISIVLIINLFLKKGSRK